MWTLGLVGLSSTLYARVLGSLPNLYLFPGTPRSSPTSIAVQLYIPDGGLFDQQIQMGFFFGTKPNGPGSPFPYGHNVEPDE